MVTKIVVLQWVHGPITVVISRRPRRRQPAGQASMGPRSDNRGYRAGANTTGRAMNSASMGPRSDNRGYLGRRVAGHPGFVLASMGPRSDNRGYLKAIRIRSIP